MPSGNTRLAPGDERSSLPDYAEEALSGKEESCGSASASPFQQVILPSSWLSSSTLLTGSWKKFISAAKAAMAEGSWPNCARSIMSIFSRRRFSLLASRSRMSRACRFSGVSFARFNRMASRSRCSRRARCSSVSCMRCRRLASRSRIRLTSRSSGVSLSRRLFLAVRSRSRRCSRTSKGSFCRRSAHFRMPGLILHHHNHGAGTQHVPQVFHKPACMGSPTHRKQNSEHPRTWRTNSREDSASGVTARSA
ncbi:hypothetical protein LUU34_01192100 [Aix galericulata]|nr:hypothetical protein LUU34_01192100 [Aix galericulata]